MNEFDQQSPNSMLRPLEPRPKTKLLKQPTPNLTLPIIDYADKYRRKHQLRAAEANELIVVGRLCLAGIQGNHRLSSYSSISSVFPNDRALRPVDETKAVKPLDRTTEQSSRPESHVFRQRVAGQKVYHYNRSGRPNDQRLNRIDSNENAFNSKNEPSSSSAVESRSASSLQQISLTCYVCGQSLPIDQLVAHEQQCKLDRKTQAPDQRQITRKPNVALHESIVADESDKNALNDGDWQQLQQQLKPCVLCGRTFFEHRLAKHESNCKGDPKRNQTKLVKPKKSTKR